MALPQNGFWQQQGRQIDAAGRLHKLALPNTLFMHCLRDPVDTCYLIHRIPFGDKQTCAHDLTALGRHYRALMTNWREQIPGRILDVYYEDTVANMEKQTRRMLEFYCLEFDLSVLAYHLSEELVKTPSAFQVHQPIYRDSITNWKCCEAHLQPLLDALNN